MMHRELLAIARDLAARGDIGPPRQASLARSVSSAYYALFHAVAWFIANETIGKRHWSEFRIVYRSLDHGRTRSVLEDLVRRSDVTTDFKIISLAFVMLQQERHRADYDVAYRSSRGAARDLIDRAEQAIDVLDRLDAESRKTLTAYLIGGRSRKS